MWYVNCDHVTHGSLHGKATQSLWGQVFGMSNLPLTLLLKFDFTWGKYVNLSYSSSPFTMAASPPLSPAAAKLELDRDAIYHENPFKKLKLFNNITLRCSTHNKDSRSSIKVLEHNVAEKHKFDIMEDHGAECQPCRRDIACASPDRRSLQTAIVPLKAFPHSRSHAHEESDHLLADRRNLLDGLRCRLEAGGLDEEPLSLPKLSFKLTNLERSSWLGCVSILMVP